MRISGAIAQLRTTDLARSIDFYVAKVGLTLEFQYEDFYAGIRAGDQLFHLKLVDVADPTIEFVDREDHFHLYFVIDDATALAESLKARGVHVVKDAHDTPWGTKEFVAKDDQGHTLYFGERQSSAR
jgi:catechol 2,3-dioxygenase-like lactoylglutathione lyase family enzyme